MPFSVVRVHGSPISAGNVCTVRPHAFRYVCHVDCWELKPFCPAGVTGIILGWQYRFCALLYSTTFWYLLALDKSRWNNHSYLFALLSLLMATNDGHAKWSLDAYLNKFAGDAQIPFWQYFLMRFQIFLVYFYAGVKKIHPDWLQGNSMVLLSQKWVFTWIRPLVPAYYIDYYLIHLGGFLFDLVVGFLLLTGSTRPVAFVLCIIFNTTNSTMFAIGKHDWCSQRSYITTLPIPGMFPWAMLAVMPIFCSPDWPLKLGNAFSLNKNLESTSRKLKSMNPNRHSRLTIKQKWQLILISAYVVVQVTLPWAYFVLPGTVTWSHGLYGYNWDMMVHNWQHVHATIQTKLLLVDRFNSSVANYHYHYLNPDKWTLTKRWYHHADLTIQYAQCARRQLVEHYGSRLVNVSLYLDVWCSLNGRFAQRMYRSDIDLLQAHWSPWKMNEWVVPLIPTPMRWRTRNGPVYRHLEPESQNASMTIYLADRAGGVMVNHIGTHLDVDPQLHAIRGWLHVRIGPRSFWMASNSSVALPRGSVIAISVPKSEPSFYAIVYPRVSII